MIKLDIFHDTNIAKKPQNLSKWKNSRLKDFISRLSTNNSVINNYNILLIQTWFVNCPSNSVLNNQGI